MRVSEFFLRQTADGDAKKTPSMKRRDFRGLMSLMALDVRRNSANARTLMFPKG
jgi:hypothetical protein